MLSQSFSLVFFITKLQIDQADMNLSDITLQTDQAAMNVSGITWQIDQADMCLVLHGR